MKKILFFILFSLSIYSQNNIKYNQNIKNVFYGVSTRAVFDLGKNLKSSFRIGISTGLGYSFYSSNLTSLNLEYSFLWSGLGTYRNEDCSYFVFSPNFTQSFTSSYQSNILNEYRNQPLYYFTDLVAPSLQNPFLNSGSVGVNFVKFFNKRIRDYQWQRIGHIGFKFNAFHIAYNNDGGPILKLIGDKEDRYFTGGGFVNVHLNQDLIVNKFNISFYKFTGYNEMSFEASDELLYSSVDYKDANQNYFNKGFWEFGIGNSEFGSAFVRINNPNNTKEFQNFIHYHMGFGYHQNLDGKYISYGLSPTFTQSYIKLK